MTALLTWLRAPGVGTSDRSRTWAAVAFGSAIVVAVPIIFYQGRNQWFFFDEWDYLVQRGVNVQDLMRPHNEHWGTIPMLIYRGLYSLVGIRSYKPYQASLIGMHVVSAILLRAVMRRGAVAPWIATTVATAFLLFGSGRQDIVWAFQIHFTGSLAFGLAHLLCADHEGEPDRRDGFGLGFGLAGLMCSAVGPVMVGVVGLAVLLRRGPKAAALHVVPLGLVFLTWWWSFGRGNYDKPAGARGALDYAWHGLTNCFVRIGQSPGVGLVLALALFAGAVLALRPPNVVESLRRWGLPLALATGALALLLVTGFGRAGSTGNDVPQATRYVYLIGALLFPALGLAINELWTHARLLGLIALAVLVSGIPGNVRALTSGGAGQGDAGDRPGSGSRPSRADVHPTRRPGRATPDGGGNDLVHPEPRPHLLAARRCCLASLRVARQRPLPGAGDPARPHHHSREAGRALDVVQLTGPRHQAGLSVPPRRCVPLRT